MKGHIEPIVFRPKSVTWSQTMIVTTDRGDMLYKGFITVHTFCFRLWIAKHRSGR